MNIWQIQMLTSMKRVNWKENGLKISLEENGTVVIEGNLGDKVIHEIRNRVKQDKYLLIQQNNSQRLEVHDAESFSSVLDVLSEFYN